MAGRFLWCPGPLTPAQLPASRRRLDSCSDLTFLRGSLILCRRRDSGSGLRAAVYTGKIESMLLRIGR